MYPPCMLFLPVVRLTNGPKNIQVSTPGTYECYLIWEKRLASVIKLIILKWEDYPRLFGLGPKCNHKYPYKREAAGYVTQKAQGDVTMEPEWFWKDYAARFEVCIKAKSRCPTENILCW